MDPYKVQKQHLKESNVDDPEDTLPRPGIMDYRRAWKDIIDLQAALVVREITFADLIGANAASRIMNITNAEIEFEGNSWYLQS